MNHRGWQSKILDAALVMVAMVVIANLVTHVVGPLLPDLTACIVIGAVVSMVVRRY
jgi:L-lactate permease